MKVYKVKVNGKVYEVELESVTEKDGLIETKANEKKEEVKEALQPASDGVDTTVVSPMQGTIVDVRVSVNQSVKKGDVVAILEAMKLENEIVATKNGTVKKVLVTKGQTVNNKEPLVVIG